MDTLINSITNEIAEKLGEKFYSASADLRFVSYDKKLKLEIPRLIVTKTSVVLFVAVDRMDAVGEVAVTARLQQLIHYILENVSISVNSLIVYVYDKGKTESKNNEESTDALCSGRIWFFNHYSNRLSLYELPDKSQLLVEDVVSVVSSRRAFDEDVGIEQIADSIGFLFSNNGDVKKDTNGNFYIRKRGLWYPSSDIDSDDLFKKCSIAGVFGIHKMSENKKALGIIYFLTCGMFGVGWLFDCLFMLGGMYRDKENKYLLPVSLDIGERASCLVVGLVVAIVYFIIWRFAVVFFGELLQDILSNAA